MSIALYVYDIRTLVKTNLARLVSPANSPLAYGTMFARFGPDCNFVASHFTVDPNCIVTISSLFGVRCRAP